MASAFFCNINIIFEKAVKYCKRLVLLIKLCYKFNGEDTNDKKRNYIC